jgi:Dolichyl-phosphate-mannose-protein mannosyltransferase
MQIALRTLFAAVWLACSLLWLQADGLVRDGDEVGHVGAAELMAAHLQRGEVGTFVETTWRGDLGDYPPLHAALLGGQWWLAGWVERTVAGDTTRSAGDALGQPDRLSVRGGPLLALLVAAVAMGLAADAQASPGGGRRPPPVRAGPAGTVAFCATLLLPMANGLSRSFMPEAGLVAFTSLAVLFAVRLGRGDREGHGMLLGLSLGLGLLLKQTYVLMVVPPLLALALGVGPRLAITCATAMLVAGPWYYLHHDKQKSYVEQTVSGTLQPDLWTTASFYPTVLMWEGLGPALGVLTMLAAGLLVQRRDWRRLGLGLMWLLGTALLLSLVPRRYPRLIAPATPAAALLLGAAVSHLLPRAQVLAASLGGAAALGWLVYASILSVPLPAMYSEVDAGCPQRFLRPPGPELGFAAVAEAARSAPPGPVMVVAGPDIPCEVQTTPAWAEHLGPYLRREGIDREVRSVDSRPKAGDGLVVDWSNTAASEEGVNWIPALSAGFRVQAGRP